MNNQEDKAQTSEAIAVEDLTIEQSADEVKGGSGNNLKQMGIAIHSFNDTGI